MKKIIIGVIMIAMIGCKTTDGSVSDAGDASVDSSVDASADAGVDASFDADAD